MAQLKPFDPESKGIIERANGFLETSFLPGRRFGDPRTSTPQLEDSLQPASQRTICALGVRPCDPLNLARGHMLELPPAARPVGFRQRVPIGREGNDYSISPAAIDRFIGVHAGLDLSLHLDGVLIADHARCWDTVETVTDPEHRAPRPGWPSRPTTGLGPRGMLRRSPDPEVAAPDSSGSEMRIRAAGSLPARPSRTTPSSTSPRSSGTRSCTLQEGRSANLTRRKNILPLRGVVRSVSSPEVTGWRPILCGEEGPYGCDCRMIWRRNCR